MSYIYRTNSPEFLDYLASVKTRDEIEADPNLCFLLEDPLLKDNMNCALLYRKAQYGTYDDKKEFIGYYLANGPELDTDTLMHYRTKIRLDDEYMRIYKIEFSDISIIDNLRVNYYGKPVSIYSDEDSLMNCWTNPCDYLGPFSESIGVIGDSNNFRTLRNLFSSSRGEGITSVWGDLKETMRKKLLPRFNEVYQEMQTFLVREATEFAQRTKNAKLEKELKKYGDANAVEHAEQVSTSVKVTTFNNLGDCARIWENMRRLNVYDSSQNKKQPVTSNLTKNPDGVPVTSRQAERGSDMSLAPSTLAVNPKNTHVPIGVKALDDDNLPDDIRRDFFRNAYVGLTPGTTEYQEVLSRESDYWASRGIVGGNLKDGAVPLADYEQVIYNRFLKKDEEHVQAVRNLEKANS